MKNGVEIYDVVSEDPCNIAKHRYKFSNSLYKSPQFEGSLQKERYLTQLLGLYLLHLKKELDVYFHSFRWRFPLVPPSDKIYVTIRVNRDGEIKDADLTIRGITPDWLTDELAYQIYLHAMSRTLPSAPSSIYDKIPADQPIYFYDYVFDKK